MTHATNQQHTPGPWLVKGEGDPFYVKGIYDVDGRTIGTTWKRGKAPNFNIEEEEAANARLIAASPYLLEELEAIVSGWWNMDQTVRTLTAWEKERYEMAQAAIAAARGGK